MPRDRISHQRYQASLSRGGCFTKPREAQPQIHCSKALKQGVQLAVLCREERTLRLTQSVISFIQLLCPPPQQAVDHCLSSFQTLLPPLARTQNQLVANALRESG